MQKLTKLIRVNHYLIVGALLMLMFGLGFTSMAHDSAIVDEVAHIPAGYSYLRYGDYRLNPEHPPLIKSWAALPLQFVKLAFPLTLPAWTTDVNGQWEAGWHFLYHDGNNADLILFWSRLPILLLSVGFAGAFYEILRRRYGTAVGLLAVFFYTLEPNILAHSRLVTTDIGVTALVFLAIYSFVRFLEQPRLNTGVMASLLLGLAQLSKFSAVLLAPLYLLLTLIAITTWPTFKSWQKRLRVYGGGLVLIGLAALLLVWLVYIPLTINMPADVQQRLVDGSLTGGFGRHLGLALVGFNHIPGVKALAQYVLGVLMVFGRIAGGNTTYFMGQVSNQSFGWFFPVTYLIKTPLVLLTLIFVSVVAAVVGYFKKSPSRVWGNFKVFSQQHPLRLAAILYIGAYSFTSITGNLNLGIRHLLSMFPFIFLLVAYAVVQMWRQFNPPPRRVASVVLGLLVTFYALANFAIYPSYLAYFNELIGGPNNAYKYVADSSVDWGQDLLRLKDYVRSNHINHIAVDYFGGGVPEYYFCVRRYDVYHHLIMDASGYDCSHSPLQVWHAQDGLPHGYMAVSETYLMNDLYYAPRRGDPGYTVLRAMTPIAKIGYSIYVYKLP